MNIKAGDSVLIMDSWMNGNSIQRVSKVRAGIVFIEWRDGTLRKFDADGKEINGVPPYFGRPYLIHIGA